MFIRHGGWWAKTCRAESIRSFSFFCTPVHRPAQACHSVPPVFPVATIARKRLRFARAGMIRGFTSPAPSNACARPCSQDAGGHLKAMPYTHAKIQAGDRGRGLNISDCLHPAFTSAHARVQGVRSPKGKFPKCTEDDRACNVVKEFSAGTLLLGYLFWARKKGDKRDVKQIL